MMTCCIEVTYKQALFSLCSVTYRLYKLLSVGTQVASTTVFVNGEDQMEADTTRYIINTVTSAASTRYVGECLNQSRVGLKGQCLR